MLFRGRFRKSVVSESLSLAFRPRANLIRITTPTYFTLGRSHISGQPSNPLFQRDPGLESQCLPAFPRVGQGIPHVILYRILHIFLFYVRTQLRIDHPDHLIEAMRPSRAHIEHALKIGFHSQAQSLDHIMDMDEVAGLASVAVDHRHLPPAHLPEELADHIGILLLGLLPGTVDGKEPHASRSDAVEAVVQLGQPLHSQAGLGVVIGDGNGHVLQVGWQEAAVEG